MYNILVFGDSITWGAWDTQGGWVSRLHSHVTSKVLKSDFKNNIHVYNMGVCGDNTNKLIERFGNEAVLRQRSNKQTYIIFAIGINDSQVYKETQENRVPFDQFLKNIDQLTTEASEFAKVIFLGLTPVDEQVVDNYLDTPEKTYTNESINRYNTALKTFCIEKQIPFIDVLEDWLAGDYQNRLVDGLHPNDKGHEKLYMSVCEFLIEEGVLK